MRLDLPNHKTMSFYIAIDKPFNYETDKCAHHSFFKIFQNAFFPLQILNYRLISSHLQKFFTISIAKIITALAFAGESLLAR